MYLTGVKPDLRQIDCNISFADDLTIVKYVYT